MCHLHGILGKFLCGDLVPGIPVYIYNQYMSLVIVVRNWAQSDMKFLIILVLIKMIVLFILKVDDKCLKIEST